MRKKIAEHMVAEPADLGARALGVRGELLARREDPRGEEGGVRARRRQADLPVVHRQGGGRRAARRADRQRLGRRRQHRLSQGHQRRHRGRARLGADRAGDQERRREEPARARAAPSPISRTARAASSSSRTKCPAARSRSRTPACSARCSACRSSTSRRWRSSASATSRSARSSSTMRSRSGRWRT